MLFENVALEPDNSASIAPASLYQALSENSAQLLPVGRIEAPTTFQSPKGMWFDEGFDIRDPEGSILTDSVLGMIAKIEGRQRQRREADDEYHRTLIRKLLSNGLRCFYYREPPLVACQRRAESYKGKPKWLSGKAMARNTDLLAKAGLIEISLGESGTATTYRVTPELLHRSLEAGVTDKSVNHRLPSERLVRLYRSNSQDGHQLEYQPNDDTRKWAAVLDDYNAFVAQQNLALVLPNDELVSLRERMNQWQDKGLPRLIRPELIQTNLYRQFNNGSFDHGGRLYGGWWINCPKDLREHITIDGKRTIELDYSGCAIRMLYHQRGLECPDDPYQLPLISDYEASQGFPRGHYRDALKKLTQALINGSKRENDMMCDLPKGVSFSPRFTRDQVMQMIEEKHAAIAGAFGSGAGIKLQRIDSDIALEIISNLKDKGVLALPIHDSFIVKTEKLKDLKHQMMHVYQQCFGLKPVIH